MNINVIWADDLSYDLGSFAYITDNADIMRLIPLKELIDFT